VVGDGGGGIALKSCGAFRGAQQAFLKGQPTQ